ncbi:MAG: hypothetical protein Q8P60_12580 [Pseudorhodobacter sp.]|nr:hypothetical protein [Pseudorhodobacter sp.]
MARVTHEIKKARVPCKIKKPEPNKDDAGAYYVAVRASVGHQRKISAIEQMYGYYTAE